MTMGLKIFNTLDRKKIDFVPIDKKNIRVYACGPTVYDYAHVGNARMSIVCDLLIKVLRLIYDNVTYTSNITDIDDKIILAAKNQNVPIDKITNKFLKIYNQDMHSLGINKPDIQPRATEYIEEMIILVEKLIKNKNAYLANNHVLFHVPSFSSYGCLSKRSKEEQISGSRVEVAPYKKYAGDFVLWKPSKQNEPGWNSPWGYGRPGWHLECSAMSESCLGLPFDIHAGGIDLTFPHHENEIAQSCSLHNEKDPKLFARYWFHNGFVLFNGEKMSKSLGNIQLVNELLKKYPSETIRLSLISSHYRQPLNWNKNLLQQSQATLNRFYRIFLNDENFDDYQYDIKDISDDMIESLLDDLNTPKALAVLNKLINDLSSKSNLKSKNLKKTIYSSSVFLGILKKNPSEWLGIGNKNSKNLNNIEELIEKRNNARINKNFALADDIRSKLNKMGIEIEDQNNRTIWRKIEKNNK